MLLVVREDTREILGKWDAWWIDCEEQADKLIADGNWTVVKEEITFMGNKVVWVR